MTSTLLIGLESPLEGPAAVEGITHGTIFLNPKFDEPKKLPGLKPTNRKLTSQNPFAERFIGEKKKLLKILILLFYLRNNNS